MSDRQHVLARVHQVLLDLEMLSEGRTAGGFDARVHGGGGGGPEIGGPGGSGVATIDSYLRRLEQWCENAEQAVDRARKSPDQPAETPGQFRDRILTEHRGRDYKQAAAIEKVSPAWIYRLRLQADLEPLKGEEPRQGAQDA